MNRAYEALVIFRASDDGFTNGKGVMSSAFKDAQITIKNEEDRGEKVLAHGINDQDRGHYYLYEFDADPQNINQISKSLKLRSEILKFLFVRKK